MILLLALIVVGQAAAPTDRFAWEIAAGALGQAQAYRYDLEIDGGAPVIVVATCAGASSPFTCSAAIPPITPASHVARVRAVDVNGTALVGPWSDPFSFQMRAVPSAPVNLRIVPGT